VAGFVAEQWAGGPGAATISCDELAQIFVFGVSRSDGPPFSGHSGLEVDLDHVA